MKPTPLLTIIQNPDYWTDFYQHKQRNCSYETPFLKSLNNFLTQKEYLSLYKQLEEKNFPQSLPVKKEINKIGTEKKRVVYSYEGFDGIALKFIAYTLHRYDFLFSQNCYAFRKNISINDAILRLRKIPDLSGKYCLKIDIHNYFNSIDVSILLEKLSFLKEMDPTLFEVFRRILSNTAVRNANQEYKITEDSHGAMAGIPIAPFFANLYLKELDEYFAGNHLNYFRYSDDILLFADTQEELLAHKKVLDKIVADNKLTYNPQKVLLSRPGEPWEYLGFSFHHGKIDLSQNTIQKMKGKIKRKADALRRWQRGKNLPPEKAAIGLIHAMNKKFYGDLPPATLEEDNDFSEFTWSKWFFPNLNTDKGLLEIDHYFQEYIRYAVTGRHYKGNYKITYQQLKSWGYKSLVHEYYTFIKTKSNP